MINELKLLWVPNLIALGIYFIFGTKFSWNERIDTWFNVEWVLLGRNFGFLGSYLIVTARYLVVTACYLMVTGCYCSLLVITARYRSLLLVPTFSMNGFSVNIEKFLRTAFFIEHLQWLLLQYLLVFHLVLRISGTNSNIYLDPSLTALRTGT